MKYMEISTILHSRSGLQTRRFSPGQRKKRRKDMLASQALDSTERTQPKTPQEGRAGVDQQGATEGPGEGKALESTCRSRTSQSQENLMVALPSTFNTDLKALLKETLQESEQEAERFNNR